MDDKEKAGLNYRLVRYFLDRKQLTMLLFLLVVVVGLFSFSQLRVEGFPAIRVPGAIINTVLPGSGPQTVEDTVTKPIEDAIKNIAGIKEINATSKNNFSSIFVTFKSNNEVDKGVQEIRSKIGSVVLPDSALAPVVIIPETSGPSFLVAITSNLSMEDLLEKGDILKKELLSLNGVSIVEKSSNVKLNLYIDLPLQYQTPDIVNQIKSANLSFPLGEIIVDGFSKPIASQTKVGTIFDVKNIPVSIVDRFGRNKIVKLGEIAKIYTAVDYGDQVHRVGFKDQSTGEFKIQTALLYSVKTTDTTDIIKFNDVLSSKLDEIKTSNNELNFVTVFNQAEQSQRQIDELVEGAFGSKWGDSGGIFSYTGYIFGGIWLLTIIMFLLVDWRSALISLFAIPLSFLITFSVLWLFDVQLNTIVLFSLVLVLGLIIDPAVVVLESMKRYADIGFKGKEIALRSAKAVGQGIWIAVFTSFVVFVPFGIVSGTFGEIIKYIPITVIPALIASYFVPMIFLTWIGIKFIKPKTSYISSEEIGDEDDISNLWGIARLVVYINRFVLKRLWLQILIVVLGIAIPVLVSVSLIGSGKVQQVQFSQPDDVEFMSVTVPLETGTTNLQRLSSSLIVEDVLKIYSKDIKTFFYGSLEGGTGGGIDITMELVPLTERNKKSKEIASDIENKLVALFGDRARAGELVSGPPSAAYPVSVEIFSNDKDILEQSSSLIAKELKQYPEVVSVLYDGQSVATELIIKPKEDSASKYGLTPASIYGQVARALGENKILEIGDTDVVLRVPFDNKPKSIDELKNIDIFTSLGVVKLGNIADIQSDSVPSSINSLDGDVYSAVRARVSDVRDVIEVQRRIDDWAKNNIDELGLKPRDLENRRGLDEFEESFQQLFAAIAFAIAVTYVIFALFFKSFVQPFIVLFTIPLILIGVFPGLVLFARGQLGFLETLGMVVLIGIVENVAIFLIDFANQRTERGMDKKEAIALSTGIRLRPIILTQLTSLAGLLPLAVFSPFWRGLAVVVVAGILTSGILSLFTTPVLYSWLTRSKKSK